MDALRNVHRMLVPHGVVLDLHPVPPDARVAREGRVLGSVDEREFWRDVEAMDAGVAAVVGEGLFEVTAEREFEIVEHWPSGTEALAELCGWGGSVVPHELAAAIEGAGPTQIRESLVLRGYRRSIESPT